MLNYGNDKTTEVFMKKFFQDFKAFIKKGNVLDMAVAVIIGAAFNPIVTSLVNSIIMPAICTGSLKPERRRLFLIFSIAICYTA